MLVCAFSGVLRASDFVYSIHITWILGIGGWDYNVIFIDADNDINKYFVNVNR